LGELKLLEDGGREDESVDGAQSNGLRWIAREIADEEFLLLLRTQSLSSLVDKSQNL